jgi:hypothetical protein
MGTSNVTGDMKIGSAVSVKQGYLIPECIGELSILVLFVA